MTTLYAAPAPTGNDANSGADAAHPKTVAGALALLTTPGDVLMLTPGAYPRIVVENRSIGIYASVLPTPVTPPGWTSPAPALGVRSVTIDTMSFRQSPNCHLHDVTVRLQQWIDVTAGGYESQGGTWATGFGPDDPHAILGISPGSHGFKAYGVEVHWGYGPGQAPFDPSAKYPEYESGAYATPDHNVTGHGDAYKSWWISDPGTSGPAPPATSTLPNGRAYNTVANAPYGIQWGSTVDAPEFYDCYIHDVNRGIVGSTNRGRPVIDGCWIDRFYSIAIQLACDSVAASTGLQITRNLIGGPFGDGADSGNPHGDALQHFCAILTGDPNEVVRIPGFRIERNVHIVRPEYRGFAQGLFLEGRIGSNNDVVYVNPLIRDNFFWQRGNNLGVYPEAIEDGLILNNIFASLPGRPQQTPAGIGGSRNARSKFAGQVLVKDNISEALGAGDWLKAVGNVTTGLGYSAIGSAALFTGPLPPADNGYAAWFAAGVRKAAYAGKGPRFATLEAILRNPFAGDDVPLFLGWGAKILVARGATITGDPSTIRGPLGDSVQVTTNVGQFRILNPAGAVLVDWTSAPTNTQVGNRVVPRHTSSAAYGTQVSQTITLTHGVQGAAGFAFNSTTISNIQFPVISLASGVTPQFNGPIAANNKKATLAMLFRFPAQSANTNHYPYGHEDAQTGMRVRCIQTGAGNKLRLGAWQPNAANEILLSDPDSPELSNANTYLLIYSLDTALGVAGFSARIWDVTNGGAPLTFNSPSGVVNTEMGWDHATGQNAQRTINYGANGPGMHISFVFLKVGYTLDASDPESFRRFMAAYIGGAGKGVFGAEPEQFLCANAAGWNAAGGLNLGVGGKLKISAGAATDVSAAAWPPVLPLKAEILTPGPYLVDQPISILISPGGYAVGGTTVDLASDLAGAFSADPVALPEGSNGVVVTYTPTVAGAHHVSGVHSGGYTAFAALTLDTINPYQTIAPGSTVTLTRAEALSLKAKTAGLAAGDHGEAYFTWPPYYRARVRLKV